ncbi:MAG: ASKHA domain-containing protein [Coriobacteriia bacterium]|nr:ASKHA domain-containing protein [Coriobacteriia bacterium]
MPKTATVRFDGGLVAQAAPGATLLDAARIAGAGIDAACSGLGTCGRCRVRAAGALSTPDEAEIAVLGTGAVAQGWRLACRARVLGDAEVDVPDAGALHVVEGDALGLAWAPDPAPEGALGLAVDLGTTTVAAALVDLATGGVLATASAPNPQAQWGADVLSRVAAARAGQAAALRDAAREQVAALAREAAAVEGVGAGRLTRVVLVGNTAMRATILGHDVTALGEAPYKGVDLDAVETDGEALGIEAFNGASVYVPPCASAFVGADVVAGLAAARFGDPGPPRIFLDVGTNAEIVLWTGERLLAASAAAGPALEGAGLSSGMRAVPGAVEDVRLAGDALELATIGGLAPKGLCGSGALALAAALLDAGVIDADGRMHAVPLAPPARVIDREDQRVLVLDDAAAVVLTQKDVRAIQLAKGAVQAAAQVLVAEAGLGVAEVSQVLVAGGFGRRLQGRVLARLGVVPYEWTSRLRFVGNAALDGARALLVSRAARAEAERLAGIVRAVDLASHPAFKDAFLHALSFPQSQEH